MRLTFGKYKDRQIAEIVVEDRDYLDWMLAQCDIKAHVRKEIRLALESSACKQGKERLMQIWDGLKEEDRQELLEIAEDLAS